MRNSVRGRCPPWTPEEDARLEVLIRAGVRYAEIATILGRTAASAERRRIVLGLPSPTTIKNGANNA